MSIYYSAYKFLGFCWTEFDIELAGFGQFSLAAPKTLFEAQLETLGLCCLTILLQWLFGKF